MQSVRNYHGFVGLNVDAENFAGHVMLPQEILAALDYRNQYKALFAYPPTVADGFGDAPGFTSQNITDHGLQLRARLLPNRNTHSCLTCVGGLFLPKRAYVAIDQLTFVTDEANGFGEGTCRVSTITCIDEQTHKRKALAEKMIAVHNRPALFLKIAREDGSFYPDRMIFFPDAVGGLSHKPVKDGEAFVLVQGENPELTMTEINDIARTFYKLVKLSYGEDKGLYSIPEFEHVKDEDKLQSYQNVKL